MREYSSACEAVYLIVYKVLNCANIATQCGILDISESQTLLLADHMGHDIAIHKRHYKQACLNKEILQLSKLLEKASGNDVEDNADDENEKIYNAPTNGPNKTRSRNSDSEYDDAPVNEQDENETGNSDSNYKDEIQKELQTVASISKTQRSTFSYSKIKRVRWSEQERNTVLKAFNEKIEKSQLPSLKDIQIFKTKNKCLNNRTPSQIKTYLHNLISGKSKL
ncbi:uncharacterized protein LOC116853859 [Odontomachus brunneus]|uniref:uncharacterized protein LOC116853859 n=1 Tax=Odontomachus brunneus TaxID=486640 RepID=UPI0013F228DC|nr:uncharacterized protein LOC116853859 [Odontomachus brunneus]